MTEDQAKTKACCGPAVVAQAIAISETARRGADLSLTGCCIASACMAWRAESRAIRWTAKDEPSPGPGWTKTSMTPSADRRFHTQWQGPPTGFCGLAGEPQ